MKKNNKISILSLNRTLIQVWGIILLAVLLLGSSTLAQTCSCGGPPLLGSLESLPGDAGNLQIGFSYDYLSISDLVSVTTELNDNTRSRDSRSFLLQADYSLTSKMTISFSIPFIRQSRTIASQSGSGENIQTKGFGDIMVLAKYSIIPTSIFSKQSIAIGVGFKLPSGESSLEDNGILLSADMQTGTGSFDYILWGAASRVISRSPSINLYASSLFRINGTNQRFGIENDSYQFGNEFRFVVGGSIRLISSLIPSVGIKYRHSQPDKFADLPLSSSGGQWVDLETGISSNLFKKFGLNISGQIPLYRKIEGTQFSTSYSISFSLFYNFNLKGSDNEFL